MNFKGSVRDPSAGAVLGFMGHEFLCGASEGYGHVAVPHGGHID
jgi:hypothetical protein